MHLASRVLPALAAGLMAFACLLAAAPSVAQRSVPVKEPREPVIIEGSLTASVNSGGGIMGNYLVPSDRRLVIEHVSFETNFVTCTFTSSIRIRISGSTGSANFFMNPLFPIALPGSSTRFTRGSQDMKLYAPPGANLQMNWTRSAYTCAATGSVAISGYLEEDLQ